MWPTRARWAYLSTGTTALIYTHLANCCCTAYALHNVTWPTDLRNNCNENVYSTRTVEQKYWWKTTIRLHQLDRRTKKEYVHFSTVSRSMYSILKNVQSNTTLEKNCPNVPAKRRSNLRTKLGYDPLNDKVYTLGYNPLNQAKAAVHTYTHKKTSPSTEWTARPRTGCYDSNRSSPSDL